MPALKSETRSLEINCAEPVVKANGTSNLVKEVEDRRIDTHTKKKITHTRFWKLI